MEMISALHYTKWSLMRRLFVSMLLLAVLLLIILSAGLALFGQTNSTADLYYDTLTMQMDVFERDITTHFDHLAASAIILSEDMSAILDQTLLQEGCSFAALTDSADGIAALQEAMLEPLLHRMLQTNCSGAFVMLEATVNSGLSDADCSRTGLYLQTSGYHLSPTEVLLYRGSSDIAKEHGIMPHRKWRLEFRTDLFPEYMEIVQNAALPPETAYRISRPFTLPGTSDQVLLVSVPLVGKDGTLRGICGYEVSASYFGTYHEQPSRLAHLSCLVSTRRENVLVTRDALCCGSADGYFHALTEDYDLQQSDRGLVRFDGGSFSYIGLTRDISLRADDETHLLAVMVPKEDYDRAWLGGMLKSCVLVVLLLFFTVSFCRYFSRRFLSPLLTALDHIKSDRHAEAATGIPEIHDLVDYLDRREKAHGETIDALEKKHQLSESEKRQLQTEYEDALAECRRIEEEYSTAQSELHRVQREIERLAYSRKSEIDPADYEFFLQGLETLTKSERKLFDYYVSGKSVPEILELTGIKESTLKYHNHNLLGKLGVSSRKQMLRYAEVMRHQQDENQEQ